jgi:hypothetical protein
MGEEGHSAKIAGGALSADIKYRRINVHNARIQPIRAFAHMVGRTAGASYVISSGGGGSGSGVGSDMSQQQDVQINPGCACFTSLLLCFSFLTRNDRRERLV